MVKVLEEKKPAEVSAVIDLSNPKHPKLKITDELFSSNVDIHQWLDMAILLITQVRNDLEKVSTVK